jgi:hypothetical protein
MSTRQLILPVSALFSAAMFASSPPSYASAATQNPTAVTIDKASQSSHQSLLLDCETDRGYHGAYSAGVNDGELRLPSRANDYSGNKKACYEQGYEYGKNNITQKPDGSDDQYASDDGNGNWDDGDDWYIG